MFEIPECRHYSNIAGLGLQGSVEFQFLSGAELEHFTVQQLGAKCLLFVVEDGEEVRGIKRGHRFKLIKFEDHRRRPASRVGVYAWLRIKRHFYHGGFWRAGASGKKKESDDW